MGSIDLRTDWLGSDDYSLRYEWTPRGCWQAAGTVGCSLHAQQDRCHKVSCYQKSGKWRCTSQFGCLECWCDFDFEATDRLNEWWSMLGKMPSRFSNTNLKNQNIESTPALISNLSKTAYLKKLMVKNVCHSFTLSMRYYVIISIGHFSRCLHRDWKDHGWLPCSWSYLWHMRGAVEHHFRHLGNLLVHWGFVQLRWVPNHWLLVKSY